jgi:hypothetical protein
MNSIRSVFAALSNLAASINGLASVIDVASGRLREQLALDGEPAPILEQQLLAGAEDTSSAKGRKAKA